MARDVGEWSTTGLATLSADIRRGDLGRCLMALDSFRVMPGGEERVQRALVLALHQCGCTADMFGLDNPVLFSPALHAMFPEKGKLRIVG